MSDAQIKLVVKNVADVQKQLARISNQLNQLGNQSRRSSAAVVNSNRQVAASFNGVSKAVGQTVRAFAGVAAAIGIVRGLVTEMSKLQKVALQLNSISTSAEDFANNLKLVYAVAQQTGTGFGETSTQLTRFTRAVQRFGGDAEHAAIVLDTLNKAFLLTGTTGAEATSVLTQMSQALTKGELSGDEFRSFAENAGLLVDELAKTMGVTVDKLKEMGAEGKITAQALIETAVRVNKEFTVLFEKSGQLPIDRALISLRNQFEYTLIQSEDFRNSMAALGGVIYSVGLQFVDLAVWMVQVPFAATNEKAAQTISVFEVLRQSVVNVTAIVSLFVKSVITGISTMVQVIAANIGASIRQFEVFADQLNALILLSSILQTELKKGFIGEDSFNLSVAKAAYNKYLADTKVNVKAVVSNIGATFGEIKDIIVDNYTGLGAEVDKAISLILGEQQGSGDWTKKLLEDVRNSLSSLDAPIRDAEGKLKSGIDRVKKLKDDFEKALMEAAQEAAFSLRERNLVLGGGSEEELEALRKELDIRKELLKWEALGVPEAQLEQLREQLEIRNKNNAELEAELQLRKDLADAAEAQLKYFNELGTQIGRVLGDAFASIVTGAQSAEEAVKSLLQQILIAIAQAAVLSAFNDKGFGANLGAIITGGAGAQSAGAGAYGAAAGPVIRIYNQGGGVVSTSKRSNGSTDIIIGQLATSISKGGNAFDTMLRRTYGLRRQGV